MRLFIILLLVAYTTPKIYSQVSEPYQHIDQLILDCQAQSIEAVIEFIDTHFDTDYDKAVATYSWVARNITYDIENMFLLRYEQEDSALIEEAFSSKTGICTHFATLFHHISTNLGLKSYVVPGYNKQNGFTDYIAHVWCALEIDQNWYLFDPTWGAGYYNGTDFVKAINYDYCALEPSRAIESHLSFDPLWQFLEHPFSSVDFQQGKAIEAVKSDYFNFRDSIKTYETQSEIEQLLGIKRRMQANGIKNSVSFNELQNIERKISNYNVRKYNAAADAYNEGIQYLNQFILYRNNQFKPKKAETEVHQIIEMPIELFKKARTSIAKMKAVEANMKASVNQLENLLNESERELIRHRAFVDKYFKTPKPLRTTLFLQWN